MARGCAAQLTGYAVGMREFLAIVTVSLLAGALFGVAGPVRPDPPVPPNTEITALRDAPG